MVYLIIPPIIIVLAVATLIVFLTRVLSSDKQKIISLSVVSKNKKRKKSVIADGKHKMQNKFFHKPKNSGNQSVDNIIDTTTKNATMHTTQEDMKTYPSATQGIVVGDDVEKIVSLRKKSMISDKIDDGEDRDNEELQLMKEIEKNPQNSEKYEKLGDYYMEHEKFNDARECYKYVLRLDPRHKRAQIAMKNLDRVLQ